MPVVANARRTSPKSAFQTTAPPTPQTYVDTPTMDYVAWLQNSGHAIADIYNPSQFGVAVIGSGGAGLAAAYELLRTGVSVTVYEAGDRIGGRLFASPSSTGDGNLFEMGAMRFTPSERVLHYYADIFNASGASNIVFDPDAFPDPGVNLTYIAFQSQTYVYDPDSSDNQLPPSYTVTSNGWNALLDDGFASADGTISLVAPNTITGWLASDPQGNAPQIQQAWQAYIDAFANSTLYEAMVRIFTDPNAPGGTQWSDVDFEFYGALGTGFGGMGPLFPICFLDILRFSINAVDSNQHALPTGTESIVAGFLNQPVTLPDGSIDYLRNHVVTNMPVTSIAAAGGPVTLDFGDGSQRAFDRVVVATSHRSMELTMGMGFSANGYPLAEPVADAVRRLHLENSSKVFVETSAFWDQPSPGGQDWPRNVVGDTILRNFYTLVYPQAPAGTGALLFSYTWADDSVKQQTFTDPQARLRLLLGDLNTISPGLAAVVAESVDAGTTQVIDWQSVPYFFGAFKLNQPGQDPYVQSLFYDFQKAGTASDTGVYLAGDSIGFLGGWVENALETGVIAAAAVAQSLGGAITNYFQSPFAQLSSTFYSYSTLPTGSTTAASKKIQVPGIVGDPAQASQS
ncbi:MAG TPA: NAD(P)/FAD-dependent oxidoreductase [Longimicrobium sp.]|nr:NAD(P)/FAD-dependent oxidoreductase [Longimicrobium sp.]